MPRWNTRHALFPTGVEAAAVLAWGMVLGGLWMLDSELSSAVSGGDLISGVLVPVGFLLSTVVIAMVIGWGFDDPDYTTTVGKAAAARGATHVLPRVAFVTMLVWLVAGGAHFGFVPGILFAFGGFLLSIAGGLMGRKARSG